MPSFRALFVFFACVFTSASARSTTGFNDRTALLSVGGSLMELGTRLSENGFTSLLAGRYSRSTDTIVRALSAYSTRWYLKNALPGVEKEIKIGKYDPALITVLLGTNGAALSNGSSKELHVPIANYTQNLVTIVKRFQAVAPNSKVLLITPPTIDEAAREQIAAARNDSRKGVLDRSNEMMRKCADACIEAAKTTGVPVWDLYSQFNAMNGTTLFSDGIHFSVDGHKVVDESLRAMILGQFPAVNDLLDTYQFPIASRWVNEDPYVPESTNYLAVIPPPR